MTREPFDLQAAWQHVATLYSWIVKLLDPARLSERVSLLRDKRRELLSWLGPAEALARRVLLLKALSLPPANLPGAAPTKGRLAMAYADRPQRHPLDYAEVAPEKWRVRFCVLPSRGAESRFLSGDYRDEQESEPRAKGWTLMSVYNAIAFARRIEALRRVLENPEPEVKRLVRYLATRRDAILRAFGAYRPPAGPARTALSDTQYALDCALAPDVMLGADTS